MTRLSNPSPESLMTIKLVPVALVGALANFALVQQCGPGLLARRP